MKTFHCTTHSAEETIALGTQLARYLSKGDILCLFGDLGTGKTTLVKGLAKGLKVDPHDVNSPTFVLMNIYEGKMPMYHFDFYRLEDVREIPVIGYDEFLYGEGVSVIEWADRMKELLPEEALEIRLSHHGEQGRHFKIAGRGRRYQNILEKMNETVSR